MTAQEKLKILHKVLKEGSSVSSVCRQNKISRKTFYFWKKKYLSAGPRNKTSCLEKRHLRGLQHPRGLKLRFKKDILRLATLHPELGSHSLSKILKEKDKFLSNHGVYTLLKELGLETREKRKEFAGYYRSPLRLLPETRKRLVEEVVLVGRGISEAAREYKVSRKTLWKWAKRYKKAQEAQIELVLALKDQNPTGSAHPRGTPEWLERKILEHVVRNPEYSTHKLAQIIPQIGNHGIQNVLFRNSLNTFDRRLEYARIHAPVSLVQPITGWLDRLRSVWQTFVPTIAPAPPPKLIKPFLLSLGSSSALALLFLLWLQMFSGQSLSSKLGLFSASISLFVGSLFFLYSMKYYFTLAIVLSFSSQTGPFDSAQGKESGEQGMKGWLARIFGRNGEWRMENGEKLIAGGLQPNLEHIKLKRYPFISVHLPFYNEKKVAERILSACTSFDYENYEVVVIDDSTDETTTIVQRFADQWNKQINTNKPMIRVIHRPTRQGFKGGALREALKHTNPKAEFIVVFDADFIPYPDTLELFIKYFKVNNNGSEDYIKNNVAAVAGYQWHVLNKSENWITRGVRTEYSGSYVIERPGQEILGAMKLIHGSVYAIRSDLLKKIGWGTSITEDFELTLRLYAQGYKVIYTPYIQGPAECVSTIKRLIRQRMRWSEGHSHCVKKMFLRLLSTPRMNLPEKLEFLYISPYYLQAFFFLVGTFSWLLAETVFRARLPFWTSLWGWSLVLTNFFALPLMNAVGLFLEEAEEKDYLGLLSFVALSYILVPFQAYASVKGFLEKQEGPWFRTPKTGLITDIFTRGKFYRWISGIIPGRIAPAMSTDISANPYLALATANNQFNQFKIRRRHLKWVGNLSVVGVSLMSIILLMMAPLIPLASAPASAQTGGFRSLKNAVPSSQVKLAKEVIESPVNVSYELGEGSLEYIFHPEPRVRVKLGNKEIETRVAKSDGGGNPLPEKAYKEGIIYTYREIFEGVDLRYIADIEKLKEEFILNEDREFESVEMEVRLTGLVLAQVGEEIQVAPAEGGESLFYFQKPYLYEEKNPENKSQGIKYEMEKSQFGWRIKKVLTDEGKNWLSDPARDFPVVLDPTLVKSNVEASGMTDVETRYPGINRKIAYVSGTVDGAAWYVVHANGNQIIYRRCLVSSGCNEDGDWSAAQDIDDDASANHVAPTLYYKSADRLWVGWTDNSGADPDDTLHLRYIDTTSSFPHSLGTHCETLDLGTIGGNFNTIFAVGDNSHAVIGTQCLEGTGTTSYLVDMNTSDCTYVSILAGSGMESGVTDLAASAVALGNNISIIYEDNGPTPDDLRHSVYDVSTGVWDSIDNDVDGADNIDEAEDFSVTTDGTSIWVLAVDGTTDTDFFRCSSCLDTAPSWTQSDEIPWSGQSNVTEASLTYISGTSSLAAFVMKDTTNEQVYTKSTLIGTISWGTEYSLSYTAGTNGNLSSVMSVASEDDIGVVILEGVALRFSTIPENSLIFLILAPFLPGVIRKLRRYN